MTGWHPVWFSPVEHYWQPHPAGYRAFCSAWIKAGDGDFAYTEEKADCQPKQRCRTCQQRIEKHGTG